MTETQDLIEGFRALDDSAEGYQRALAYATGDLPEQFASDRIRMMIEQSGKGYKFRFSKVPITVLANRVQVASITGGSAEINARIEQIRQANDMEKQEPFLIRELFTFGDAYLLAWPIEPEEIEQRDGEPVDVQASEALRTAGVELTYQSPLSCRALYDSEDGRRMRFAVRRWKEATVLGEIWRVELWYTDRIESWISRPGAKGYDPEDWEPYAEDVNGKRVPAGPGVWPMAHDWEEIPIKHARTDLPYGRPEHFDAYGPQDAITKAIITQVTVGIESYGWAERYRLMDDAQILDTARDAVNWTDNVEMPVTGTGDLATTGIAGTRRGPGTETKYFGTRAVGQFEPPDPGQLIDPIEQWVRFMATVTSTPLYEFDPRDSGQMSGIARLRADAPLRAKEKDRKRYLLGFFREVWHLALRMDGVREPGLIEVAWTPPEVISDPDWWAVAQTRLSMGVPIRRILEEANYLPEQIEEWLDAAGEESTLDAKIDRMQRLGEALQSIGAATAVAPELLDQARVSAMVTRIMGEAS
jgi:hypothetical protein